jgi:hypothetical protein
VRLVDGVICLMYSCEACTVQGYVDARDDSVGHNYRQTINPSLANATLRLVGDSSYFSVLALLPLSISLIAGCYLFPQPSTSESI